MPSQTFPVVDLRLASDTLHQLHERVVRNNGRVEITRSDTGETCVLITKAELDTLEQTIELLGSTDAAVELHTQVAQIARQVGPSGAQFAQA